MGCCTLRWLGKTHFSRLDLVSIFCYPLEKQRAFPFLYALFCSKSVSVRFTTVARLGANSGLTCHNWLASATNMLPFLVFFFFFGVCVCAIWKLCGGLQYICTGTLWGVSSMSIQWLHLGPASSGAHWMTVLHSMPPSPVGIDSPFIFASLLTLALLLNGFLCNLSIHSADFYSIKY